MKKDQISIKNRSKNCVVVVSVKHFWGPRTNVEGLENGAFCSPI